MRLEESIAAHLDAARDSKPPDQAPADQANLPNMPFAEVLRLLTKEEICNAITLTLREPQSLPLILLQTLHQRTENPITRSRAQPVSQNAPRDAPKGPAADLMAPASRIRGDTYRPLQTMQLPIRSADDRPGSYEAISAAGAQEQGSAQTRNAEEEAPYANTEIVVIQPNPNPAGSGTALRYRSTGLDPVETLGEMFEFIQNDCIDFYSRPRGFSLQKCADDLARVRDLIGRIYAVFEELVSVPVGFDTGDMKAELIQHMESHLDRLRQLEPRIRMLHAAAVTRIPKKDGSGKINKKDAADQSGFSEKDQGMMDLA